MRRAAALLCLAFPSTASAATFETPPATYSTTGAPVTMVLGTGGLSQSSGVAYRLNTETAWHRCLAPGTVSLNLPVGDYSIQIADDTSRPWFDANLPQSTTPECSETTAPRNAPIALAYFYVRNPPPAPTRIVVPRKVTPDPCGDELERVGRLHVRYDFASDRYHARHTTARRRALRKAKSAYLRARKAYVKHC